MLIVDVRKRVMWESDRFMCSQVERDETRRQGESRVVQSPCLLVSLSPFLLILAALFATGCQREKQQPAPAARPRPSVALHVLVVNEPELAESIARLRGEWAEHGGGSLTAESMPWAKLATTELPSTDVVVFPMRQLGDLCLKGSLRPVRDSVLHGQLYHADSVFPLAREIGTYGRRTVALPIAVQMPLFGYREDRLATIGNAPPSSWQNYRELLSRVAQAPSVFPARDSVSNWPALMLLARAAAYASHPQKESILFDPQTMEPRIAEAPFLRALEEWRSQTGIGSKANENDSGTDATEESDAELVWAELPGTEQVFNRSTGEWEALQGGLQRVPFLADGWLIAVSSGSRNAVSAFELAAWLASGDISAQLTPAFKDMLPCRRGQFLALRRGPRKRPSLEGNPTIVRAAETAFNRSDALIVPRIPGMDEYLVALSSAVEEVLQAKRSPADALQAAARQWDELTNRLGRDSQRTAYLDHLGIAKP
jgi:multiple sugar transport system substrate-binding protein